MIGSRYIYANLMLYLFYCGAAMILVWIDAILIAKNVMEVMVILHLVFLCSAFLAAWITNWAITWDRKPLTRLFVGLTSGFFCAAVSIPSIVLASGLLQNYLDGVVLHVQPPIGWNLELFFLVGLSVVPLLLLLAFLIVFVVRHSKESSRE